MNGVIPQLKAKFEETGTLQPKDIDYLLQECKYLDEEVANLYLEIKDLSRELANSSWNERW